MVYKHGFGTWLKGQRADKRQTVEQAAVSVGTNRQTWSTWERGTVPSIRFIAAVSEWAGVDAGELTKAIIKEMK